MMKKLALVVGFLIVLGGSAVATHAQTPVDPTIALHYPDPAACPTGAYCVNLDFDNTTGFPEYINELFPTVPPSGLPDTLSPGPPPSVTYSCDGSGGLFLFYAVTDPPFPVFPVLQTSASFLGCDFAGIVPPGESTYTISSSGGPIVLELPPGSDFSCQAGQSCSGNDIDLTPELGTGILFLSGLLIFSLGGFARKRFGVSSHT